MLQLKTMSARGILFQVLSRLGTQTGSLPHRDSTEPKPVLFLGSPAQAVKPVVDSQLIFLAKCFVLPYS